MSMRCIWRRVPDMLLLVLMLLPQPVAAQPRQPAPRKPSLDLLVQRVNAYWRLLQSGKKLQASEFVEEGGREEFVSWQAPSFSSPRLIRIEPADGWEEAAVTTEVKRLAPPLTTPIAWPVREMWIFRKGNWFLSFSLPRVPLAGLAGNSSQASLGPVAPSPEEIERQKKTIRERLRFEPTEFDFGTIRKGRSASAVLQYHLSGDEGMSVKLMDAPSDLLVHGIEDGRLKPGEQHKISLELMSENYDGRVERGFTAQVQYRDATEQYRFTFRADVYAPVSAFPSPLRFQVGETEKEIVVRNNSRSDVTVVSASSEGRAFRVGPLPQTLAPGKEMRLNVKLILPSNQKNQWESVDLRFDRRVEDMESLLLPVIINAVERRAKSPLDLTPGEIEKMIRDSQRPPE